MLLTASLVALFSALLLVQAAPAPFPTPAPEPVVDRLSIVASNRARFSAAASASSASAASLASVASASAAAASKASIVSVRSAIVASNRSRLGAGAPSGFATVTTTSSAVPMSTTTPALSTTLRQPAADFDKWLYRIAQMRSAISNINAACATQTTKAYSDCTFGANRSSTQAASAATPAAVAPTSAA